MYITAPIPIPSLRQKTAHDTGVAAASSCAAKRRDLDDLQGMLRNQTQASMNARLAKYLSKADDGPRGSLDEQADGEEAEMDFATPYLRPSKQHVVTCDNVFMFLYNGEGGRTCA